MCAPQSLCSKPAAEIPLVGERFYLVEGTGERQLGSDHGTVKRRIHCVCVTTAL
jgi:hypothetical protein